ncbi:MAG: hypothetical protein U0441_39185 [Polyangiaceae bacterium]
MVEECVEQLVGDPAKGGHFFTIWGYRQAGKTWLQRRAIAEIRARHGDRFVVGSMSMEALLKGKDGEEVFFQSVPRMFGDAFPLDAPVVAPVISSWDGWRALFHKQGGLFDRPLILLIDEFDSLPPAVIDSVVGEFRRIYLNREQHWLHGLALIGVRAVLGLDSERGSPFNVQRSLHVQNLTRGEVGEMFDQYQAESGQVVETSVVDTLYTATRGRPGLVGWFGELLTEKYNRGQKQPITLRDWENVYGAACQIEPNNTVLNLIKKARGPYRDQVMGLFGNADVPFAFDQDWCNFLYLHGIIDYEDTTTIGGAPLRVCRFSCPFVQLRLHNAFSADLSPRFPARPLEFLDTLADVFTEQGIALPALLMRYKAYLGRLKAKGQDPFTGERPRSDLGLREAVGHFHLYAWLREAVGWRCAVSPEFPTGNGKVDLFLKWEEHRGVIEVKSFRDAAELPASARQAARYARSQGLSSATIALFGSSDDEAVLSALSREETVDGVRVVTVAIGWT